jgi:RHS repeat-associated protein
MLSVSATPQNQLGGGYTYDSAGNMTAIPPPIAATYVYNAESELTSATNAAGTVVSYLYDGDGKRVSKSNGKLYWYGGGSDPIAETAASGSTTDEYIFFGGKRLARIDASANVVYYVADHLGTSRIVTSSTGGILDQSDFYPFGGERIITASSGNTYKFTGKERDSESNLDNFGARYYASSMGRMMSPDWSAKVMPVPYAKLGNPQSLNLYAYVFNNPLSHNDPDGHTANCAGANAASCAADLKELAPGTKVAADGTVIKGSLLQRIVNHLDGNGAGQSLVSRIVNDSHLTTITADPGNPRGGEQLNGDVKYDPAGATIETRGADGNLTGAATSGAVILGHELIHQDHENRGLQDNSAADHIFSNAGSVFRETVSHEEFRTTGFSSFVMPGDITENQLERQLGAPIRATYTGPDSWTPVPPQP